jgi:hypothetical protein
MKTSGKTKTHRESLLAYYQAFLSPVVGEFSLFVNEFEILKPTLTESVSKRFIQNPYLAYRTLMIALGSQCGIRAHQLLAGNGGLPSVKRDNKTRVPPSLRLLVHPFLEENEAEYAKILDRLACDPPERMDLVLHLEDAPVPFAERERLNRQSKASPERQRQDFLRRVESIREDWMVLEKTREGLDDLRNKVFAHLELVPDTVEFFYLHPSRPSETLETFRNSLTPSLRDLCQTFELIIPHIGNCLTQLAFVLVRAHFNFPSMRQQAARAATLFWESQRVT